MKSSAISLYFNQSKHHFSCILHFVKSKYPDGLLCMSVFIFLVNYHSRLVIIQRHFQSTITLCADVPFTDYLFILVYILCSSLRFLTKHL